MKCPNCHSDNPDTKPFCADCGTRLFPAGDVKLSLTDTLKTPVKGLSPGILFADRYEIIEELGRGGMGVVYKASDTRLKRTVALKFLPPEFTQDPTAKNRFIQEARAAAALDHANICTVHEVDEVDGQNFITMSYIKGGSLKEKLKSGPLNMNEITNIAIQMAEGLQEAGEKGIVHRDIKPANIMLTEKGQVKIMDFGVAKLAGLPGATKPGSTIGTVAFMSPEQARGEELDSRTDIWSFGVVLYEMLTGKLPFQGENEAAVIYNILNEEPKAIQHFRPDVPDNVITLVPRLLQKDPVNRIAPAKEIIRHLKTKITAKAIKEDKKSIAVLYFENMSSDKENEYFCAGMTEDLIIDLSKIQKLRVIPRSDVLPYRGKEIHSRQVGETLKVQYILEGSVRRSGNKIRITAQLIDVRSGFQVWAERYDRLIEDIFEIQMEVSEKIAAALKVTLTESEKKSLAKKPTDDIRAYDFYMRGTEFMLHKGKQNNDAAIQMFERALSIDSNFSLVYVGLAEAYTYNYMFYSNDRFWLEKIMEVNEKALSVDPDSLEAQLGIGMVYFHQKRLREAKKSFEKIVAVNRDFYQAYYFLGFVSAILEDYDSTIKSFKRCAVIKPYSEEPWHYLDMIYRKYGKMKAAQEARDKVIELGTQMLKLNPEDVVTISRMALCYASMGESKKSLELTNEIMTIDPNDGIALYNCAGVYATLGNKKEAFVYLKRALEFGFTSIIYESPKVDPFIEPIRGDPEFKRLLAQYGY
jgi:non-specific serine/threonine protein kinase